MLSVPALMLASCGDSQDDANATDGAKDKGKIGLVFDIGGKGDKSFNDSAFAGPAAT